MPGIDPALQSVIVAIAAGVFLLVIARRLEISAIVLLFLGGVLLGPSGAGVVQPGAMGNGLRVLIAIAVALILFEGGLTLDVRQYRSAPRLIRRLLTVGVLMTWLLTAAVLWWLFGFDLGLCLLAASLVVVTGPTVVGPLLKRIKVKPEVHGVLHWEGVLIDPVGVIIALLCYEWLVVEDRELVLVRFVLRFLWGAGLGFAWGWLSYRLMRARWIPSGMTNVSALASAVLLFGISEMLFHESGLLAVTVAGLVLGRLHTGDMHRVREFKAEITDLLIGMLFILLSAGLDLTRFSAFGLPGLAAVLILMVVVRPLSVMLCALGSSLSWRARLFIGWVAPRGIVAASMASLFSLNLREAGFPDAGFLETFTYSVIAVTVVVHSLTAGLCARLLGLRRPAPTGWLIVGAHRMAREVAQFIEQTMGHRVVLMDTNPASVDAARRDGLTAMRNDARDPELGDLLDVEGLGHLLALTDNEDLNMLLCERWSSSIERERLFYWATSEAEEGQRTGTAVWTRLPKPSMLSGELDRGEAIFSRRADGEDAPPLAVVYERRVNLTPEPGTAAFEEPQYALLLRRDADLLGNAVDPDLCIDVDAKNLEELFGHLLAAAEPFLSETDLLALGPELVERERSQSSGIGHGVALPHGFSRKLAGRLCIIARCTSDCPIEGPDGEPVQLVFLLLSGAGDAEGHLKTLAEIARTVRDDDVRRDLLSAADAADMADVLRDFTR